MTPIDSASQSRRASVRASAFPLVLFTTWLVAISCTDSTVPSTPGRAVKLAFTIQPQNTLSQTVMAPIVVAVEDAHGNIVTTPGYTVALGLTANPETGFSGTNDVKTVNGIATFSGITLFGPGPGNTFTADARPDTYDISDSIATATSVSFEITSGPAAKLAFTVAPSVVDPIDAITPAVAVTILDTAGNKVWRATNRVTLTLGSDPAGGTLRGTTTVAPSNGVAIFSNLSIDNPGPGYTFAAAAPGLAVETSNAFEVRKPLTFVSVSAGQLHSCGISTDGGTYCWGRKTGPAPSGYDGIAEDVSATPVSGGVQLASVTSHVGNCGLTASGALYCWGRPAPTGTYSPYPVAVPGAPTLTTVSVYNHTCGITPGGDGYCWGGDGATTYSSVPVAAAGGLKFTVISTGYNTCGVATTNAAYCWDYNNATPAVAMSGVSFTTLSVGEEHACGISTAGAAYCWGHACIDCLGTGPGDNAGAVVGGLKFASISVGKWYTCAVTTAGAAYCWGYNINGELGDGSSGNSRSVPTRVAGNLTFASISAGDRHTCGVTTTGAAYCWGYGYDGQLGAGTLLNSTIPIRVR